MPVAALAAASLSALHSMAQVFGYLAPISSSLSELRFLYGSLSLGKDLREGWNRQKSLNTLFNSQRMMKMTPITSAIWMRVPRLRTKNPSSHKIARIIPITNKILMLPPCYSLSPFVNTIAFVRLGYGCRNG